MGSPNDPHAAMNIGILTFHRAVNYGAFLQSYSLCKALNRAPDVRAEVIDYAAQSAWNYYDVSAWPLKKKLKSFGKLKEKSKQLSVFTEAVERGKGAVFSKDTLVSDDPEAFRRFVKGRYDAIVVGSDEVWKVNSFRRFPSPYFLPGDYGCAKFSYAASFGKAIRLTADEEAAMQACLSDFSLLSVRDRLALDYVGRNLPEARVLRSCDPSFLYDFREELQNCSDPLRDGAIGIDPNKKTVAVMVDDASAERIRSQLGGKYNLVSLFDPHKGYLNATDLDPFRWLKVVSGADFVISCFFHCVCFSICNDTPFLALGTKNKRHKLEDLLLHTPLERRYLSGEQLETADYAAQIETLSGDTGGFARFASDMRSGFEDYVKLLKP